MACYKNIIYGPSANATTPDTTANVVLPTTGKPKLRIQTVYGDDGTQVAYYEYTLTVDTVIYSKVAVLADIELEVKRIKTILTAPGYTLVIYPVGLGEFPAITGPFSTIANATPDIKGGPYPQEVTVEPIGSNEAISVSWSVMFRTLHCPSTFEGLIQYNSELDFDVDDDGDLTFNLRVTYQRSTPITDISDLTPLVKALARNAGMSFQGMKRRKRTSLSRDQRTAHIHVEFKDIKSDNAFFPSTRHIQATDEISSDLIAKGLLVGTGFMSWNRKITATITLPARVHKSYAWYVYLRILSERFKRLHQLSKLANVLNNEKTESQKAIEAADENTKQNNYILTRIRITDDIYTRSIHFETDYFVISDLDNILNKSRIFCRVNTNYVSQPSLVPGVEPVWVPRPVSDQWQIWDNATSVFLNGSYQYEPTNTPIVYNQCTGSKTDPKFGPTVQLPDENNADPTISDRLIRKPDDAAMTWLSYKNRFSISEWAKTVQASYLQKPPPQYYESPNPPSTRKTTTQSLNGKTSAADPAQADVTVERGASSFSVRMVGHALRVGHKIDFPVIESVGGKSVKRTGESVTFQEQISQSEIPVYFASWDITYTVDKDMHVSDVAASIKTSGDPSHYT